MSFKSSGFDHVIYLPGVCPTEIFPYITKGDCIRMFIVCVFVAKGCK